MPLIFKEQIASETFLGIWKKDEDHSLLKEVYPLIESEKAFLNKISNLHRINEWYTTRILLTEMLKKRVTIEYTLHGKPFLSNCELEISISHSKQYVAIITSNIYSPGIDVEHISNRVQKIAHKFLTDSELNWCADLERMTACWSAKEAIFKVFEKNLDFKDIEISLFDLGDAKGNFSAMAKNNIPFSMQYMLLNDNILVYTLFDKEIHGLKDF